MKKMLVFFLLLSAGMQAQEHPIISFFTARTVSDNVLLTWNIVGGNNCNGIEIEHSADGQNFQIVGNIPGICGEQAEDEPYTFLHEKPVENHVNYYRLKLGGQGFTTPLAHNFYKVGEDGFTFFPNPSQENIQIYISDQYPDAQLEIIDMNGKVVFDGQVQAGVLEDVSLLGLNSGNYIIRLRNENKLISSKKMIRL